MEAVTPRINDVLFGRGTSINAHQGNRQLRSLVETHRPMFLQAKKNKQKRAVAELIYNEIQSLHPPGRFLEETLITEAQLLTNVKDDSVPNSEQKHAIHHSILKKNWLVVEQEKALLKILKRLREKDQGVGADYLPISAPSSQQFLSPVLPFSNSSLLPVEHAINDGCPVVVAVNARDQLLEISNHGAQEVHDTQLINNWLSVDDLQLQSHIVQEDLKTLQRTNATSEQMPAEQKGQEEIDGAQELSKYIEGNGLNFHEETFLQTSTPQPEIDASAQLCEYTLRQWIESVAPIISLDTAISVQSSEHAERFIQSALLIALKLTESIIEAEKDEQNGHGNPIPLASITPGNILIRARKYQHAIGESSKEREKIEFVWVMSIVGDDSATGTIMSRLFAIGKVLYELFSTENPSMDDDLPFFQTALLDSMTISNKAESGEPAQKKIQWQSEYHADSRISNYVAGLEANRVPLPLCDLIINLLECRHDPMCGEGVYTSFYDLQEDLQLMVDNPSCFLNSVHLSDTLKLVVPDKLYGRDEELLKLEELYESHITSGQIIGVLISGGAGIGKSTLAQHMQTVTSQSNGYFLFSKFEHNQMSLKPLSTIANIFDSLCEMLFNDSPPSRLTEIESELTSALGTQPNLLRVVPNLEKLMPSCSRLETSANNCVDSTVSLRYQCVEFLRVVSSHLKPITIVIDDIHFADQTSLLVVKDLLLDSSQQTSIFFVLCHRDDETVTSESFVSWLATIAEFLLDSINLESISPEAITKIIAETMHLSPRLVRPLSSVLHQKTRGNPLFLRQLLDSLTEQGYIYVDMKHRKWSWDLESITDLEISHDVLALLMNDIQRLPRDLQSGLQVVSCIGSCITESMLNYLLMSLTLDLKEILQQVSQRGFMIDIAGSTMFRFAHDKIRQAAYELMTDKERREIHMRLGLALCVQTIDNLADDDEKLFFAAVNQINLGGPTAVHDPSQMIVIAQLNLKAGKLSIELSDYITAFKLFQHGLSFMGENHWLFNYQLSLDLCNAMAESALTLNNLAAVTYYTDIVILHGKCFEDKLHCLITSTQALGVAYHQEESIKASFAILAQFGENIFSDSRDDTLTTDIDHINSILRFASDDMICNMQESNDKNVTAIIHLYETLAHVLQYFMPWLLRPVSLRMVELTMKTGLSAKSPLVFAHFGGILVTSGRISDGCRLGRLALKLVERKGSSQYKSSVICFVYDKILWVSEPFQLIVEAHLLGHKSGQQSGDVIFAMHNLLLATLTDYVAGQHLTTIQENILDFISKLEAHGLRIFFKHPILLLSQVMVLKEGMQMSGVTHVKSQPSEAEILADASLGPSVLAYGKLHLLTRAFLFREMDDVLHHFKTYEAVSDSNHQLNPHFLMGYFFEGLASFQLARETSDTESVKWIERGQSVLAKMQCWNENSSWNWRNKTLLLEAESMHMMEEFDAAGSLYDSAIRSAHEHKFIHEEAIASELAGMFFYARGSRQKSYSCLLHSVACYEKWGAHAVARRIKAIVCDNFGNDTDLMSGATTTLECNICVPVQSSGRKRQGGS